MTEGWIKDLVDAMSNIIVFVQNVAVAVTEFFEFFFTAHMTRKERHFYTHAKKFRVRKKYANRALNRMRKSRKSQ